MKKQTIWFLVLFVILALAACQSAAPEPDAGPAGEAYPQPGEGSTSGEAYPRPEIAAFTPIPVPGSAEILYPGPNDGEIVSWIQAEAMILNHEVIEVTQTHDLLVTLKLKDGRTLSAYEPTIDEVFRVIERCGDPCANMTLATE